MLILDRVVCDGCHCLIGQIIGGEVVSPGHLVDLSLPPHSAYCPDCAGQNNFNFLPVVG